MREINLKEEVIVTADSVNVVTKKATTLIGFDGFVTTSIDGHLPKLGGTTTKMDHPASNVGLERIGPGLFEHPYSEFMNSRL